MILLYSHIHFIHWVARRCPHESVVGSIASEWLNHANLSNPVPGLPELEGGFTLHWSPRIRNVIFTSRRNAAGNSGAIRPFIVINARGEVRFVFSSFALLAPRDRFSSETWNAFVMTELRSAFPTARRSAANIHRRGHVLLRDGTVQPWVVAYDRVALAYPAALPPLDISVFHNCFGGETDHFIRNVPPAPPFRASLMGIHPCKQHRKLKSLPLP